MASRRYRRTVWSIVIPFATLGLFWWGVRSGGLFVLAGAFSQWLTPILLPHL